MNKISSITVSVDYFICMDYGGLTGGEVCVSSTVNITDAGQAGLLSRGSVVVLSAALAVGPVREVSAAQTAPPTAGAPVLLRVEHTLVRPSAAVTDWEDKKRKKEMGRCGLEGRYRQKGEGGDCALRDWMII